MKVTELMIGDVVSVVPSGQHIRIAAIHNGKVGYHSVEYRLEWVRISLIRPIPLTTEILNRNDFDSDKDEKGFVYNEGKTFIAVSFDPNYISVDYNCMDEDGASSLFMKRDGGELYVHDLQHFWRMCGFKKELEL